MNLFPLLRGLIWLGLSTSGISITWKLWDLSQEAWWLVAAGIAGVVLGVAVAPLAGLLADRPHRKTVLALSLALGAVAEAGLLLASTPLSVLLAGQALGLSLSPAFPAFSAHLLSATAEDKRAWLLGKVTSAEAAGMIAGTLLAGVLLSVGNAWPFLIAGLCLLVGSGIALLLPGGSNPLPEKEAGGVWAGVKVLKGSPVLRLALGAAMFMAISRQLAIVSEAPLVSALGGGGAMLAVISAAWSGGMLLGGPLAGKLVKPGGEIKALFWGRLIASLGMAAIGLSAYLWQPVLAYLICGVAWAFIPVASNLLIAAYASDQTRGRLMAAQGAAVQIAQGAGMVAAGATIAAAGAQSSFLLAGAVGLLGLPLLIRAGRRAAQLPKSA